MIRWFKIDSSDPYTYPPEGDHFLVDILCAGDHIYLVGDIRHYSTDTDYWVRFEPYDPSHLDLVLPGKEDMEILAWAKIKPSDAE